MKFKSAEDVSKNLDDYDVYFLMEHLRNRFLSVAKDPALKSGTDKKFGDCCFETAMHIQEAMDAFIGVK